MAEDLRAWLGKRLREARTQAGYSSVDALARDLGFERSVISKIETGERAPSEDAAEKISGKFPGIAGGNFVDLSAVARNSERKASKYAEWFGKTWVPIEAVATGLRSFQPVIMPGLLQTEDYARVLARKSTPGASADDIQLRVDGRQSLSASPRPTCG